MFLGGKRTWDLISNQETKWTLYSYCIPGWLVAFFFGIVKCMPDFIWTAGITSNFVNPLHLCMVSLKSASLLKSSESEWITEFKRQLNILYQYNIYTFLPLCHQWWSLPFNRRNAKYTEILFTVHVTTLVAPRENLKKCSFLAQWKFTVHDERPVSAEAY